MSNEHPQKKRKLKLSKPHKKWTTFWLKIKDQQKKKKEGKKKLNNKIETKEEEIKEKPVDDLREIYSDQDGELPDMTQLDRDGKSRLTRWLIGTIILLLVISGAAWSGFLFISRGFFNTDKPLVTSIEGPLDVFSGDEATYTISYSNHGDVPLAALEIRASLPPGFELQSTTPEMIRENTWMIGSLSPKSDGKITLKGKFRSAVPSTARIQVFFTYRPANFNSEFQDIQTLSLEIDESVLDLKIDGPEKALSGDEVAYTIDLSNDSDKKSEQIRINTIIPDDFVVSKIEPESSREDILRWNLDEILPGETKTITITGSYTSSAQAEQTISAEALFIENAGIELLQTKTKITTDVLGGNLTFNLIVNGGTKDQTSEMGKTLRISLDYENKGNETIENATFDLDFSNEDSRLLPIEWVSIELPENLRHGNHLIWNQDIIPDLEKIEPGQSGIIDISLPLLTTIDPTKISDKFTISLSAAVEKIGSIEGKHTVEASPIIITLNSKLKVLTEARYFNENNEPVGTGPLPPEVGKITTYRIYMNLNSNIHDIEEIYMSTNLPPDVTWTGKTEVSDGEINFDHTTRLVTWKINNLKRSELANTWFEIAIIPETNDTNAFFKLTNATLAEAVDSFSKDKISEALDILTTELPTDEKAQGKGIVVEANN